MKYSYIWSQYTFSKILDVQDKTPTGLWLLLFKFSDFLYNGLTSASFNCGGKHDSLIDKFIMFVIGLHDSLAEIFNILGGIPS